jgi:uncharacterized protein involved in exopolysaccharide biosynthesis
MMIDNAYPVYTPVYPRKGFMTLLAAVGSFLFLVAYHYFMHQLRTYSRKQE